MLLSPLTISRCCRIVCERLSEDELDLILASIKEVVRELGLEDVRGLLDEAGPLEADLFHGIISSQDFFQTIALQSLFVFKSFLEYALDPRLLDEDRQNGLCRELSRYLKLDNLELEPRSIESLITYELIGLAPPGPTVGSFEHQFPFGLPFGYSQSKPPLAVVTDKEGSQRAFFSDAHGMGVIRGGVYPNFCLGKIFGWWYEYNDKSDHPEFLWDVLKSSRPVPGISEPLLRLLIALCQTEAERKFLRHYFERYVTPYITVSASGRTDVRRVANAVPCLLPQAWLQWTSLPKKKLQSPATSDVDSLDLYRVDFVAFWREQRYIIEVDDVGHYAAQRDNVWEACPPSYAKTLKQTRALEQRGWRVIRFSNWETEQTDTLDRATSDLQHLLGFPTPQKDLKIPF